MKNLFNRVSKFFNDRHEQRERLKNMIITARGGFEKKAEHIFKNKEVSLKTLRLLDKLIQERMQRQRDMKNGKK